MLVTLCICAQTKHVLFPFSATVVNNHTTPPPLNNNNSNTTNNNQPSANINSTNINNKTNSPSPKPGTPLQVVGGGPGSNLTELKPVQPTLTQGYTPLPSFSGQFTSKNTIYCFFFSSRIIYANLHNAGNL